MKGEIKETPPEIAQLIAATGMKQQRCTACGKPLQAWSKDDKAWSCPRCEVPNATVAMVDAEAAAVTSRAPRGHGP